MPVAALERDSAVREELRGTGVVEVLDQVGHALDGGALGGRRDLRESQRGGTEADHEGGGEAAQKGLPGRGYRHGFLSFIT